MTSRTRRTQRQGRRSFGSILDRRGRKGFYIEFRWKRRRVKRFAGLRRQDAEGRLAALEALLKGGVNLDTALADVFDEPTGKTLTFTAAVDPYLEYAKPRKKASTYAADELNVRAFAKASWAKKPLADVKPADLQRWIGTRTKRRQRKDAPRVPISPTTANRNLALISAVFKWAVMMGYVAANPASASLLPRRRVTRSNRATYLTAMEARSLLEACSPTLRPLVEVALHTGMRRGELLELRWRALDLKRRQIHVAPETEKAGRGRVIDMNATVLRTLKARRRKRPTLDGSDHVFALKDGTQISPSRLRSWFTETVKRCDALPLDKRARLRFHDLRHCAASLMVAAGVPIFDVSKVLGHSTVAVTMRYAHFAPKARRAAVDRLEAELLGKATKKAPKRSNSTP